MPDRLLKILEHLDLYSIETFCFTVFLHILNALTEEPVLFVFTILVGVTTLIRNWTGKDLKTFVTDLWKSFRNRKPDKP